MKKLKQLLPTGQKVLASLIIFLAPSNLFLKLGEESAYVSGLMVDYLIPKVYVVDLAAFLLLLLYLAQQLLFHSKTKQKNPNGKRRLLEYNLAIILLIIIIFFRQFFTANQIASIWFFNKLLWSALTIWLLKKTQYFQSSFFKLSLVLTLGFQTLLAYYQFLAQHHLGGYLFLGETNLNQLYGLARGSLLEGQKVLAYGTTAHPNILGGLSLIYFWLFAKNSSNHKLLGSKPMQFVMACCLLSVLILTQSISAALATAAMLLIALGRLIKESRGIKLDNKTSSNFFKLNNLNRVKLILFSLILILVPFFIALFPDSSSTSFTRRNYLNSAAVNIISQQPVFGVGLNNFTLHLESSRRMPEVVRFVQPVHHFILLWASETGFLGVLLLLLITIKLLQGCQQNQIVNSLLVLAPIMALDHYLLTISTGQLSFFLILAAGCQKSKKVTTFQQTS